MFFENKIYLVFMHFWESPETFRIEQYYPICEFWHKLKNSCQLYEPLQFHVRSVMRSSQNWYLTWCLKETLSELLRSTQTHRHTHFYHYRENTKIIQWYPGLSHAFSNTDRTSFSCLPHRRVVCRRHKKRSCVKDLTLTYPVEERKELSQDVRNRQL